MSSFAQTCSENDVKKQTLLISAAGLSRGSATAAAAAAAVRRAELGGQMAASYLQDVTRELHKAVHSTELVLRLILFYSVSF